MSRSGRYEIQRRPHIGLGAVVGIVVALGGMVASCAGQAVIGLALAVVAVLLGLVGILGVAARARSHLVSNVAIGLGILGIIVAILVMVFDLVIIPFR